MHQVYGRVAGEGKIPLFFPDVLPPVVSSPVSPSSGASVQLRWAKAYPCHGGCPGEVNVVAGRLLLAGRSGGGPHTPASGGVVAVAVARRCSAVPSSYVAVADRGGAPGSGEVRFRSSFSIPSVTEPTNYTRLRKKIFRRSK